MDHNHHYSFSPCNFFHRPKPIFGLEGRQEEEECGVNAYLEHRCKLPLFPMHGEDHLNGGSGDIWKYGQSNDRDCFGRDSCASLELQLTALEVVVAEATTLLPPVRAPPICISKLVGCVSANLEEDVGVLGEEKEFSDESNMKKNRRNLVKGNTKKNKRKFGSGNSSHYDSGTYSADVKKFRKLVLDNHKAASTETRQSTETRPITGSVFLEQRGDS
ncbi:predicted protein [Arabidopsis lyrata subsp. lyrata]|uniref:Predicted protein n=1 Tax=Arabidopsis lyrata subsp. lyrata TaxID=81972 RepID=D7L2Q4_ARALL|nr:predicted protein [Arabidopsis lyrata subsp. lyrata]